MATARPSTPPPSAPSNLDITPEQVRRLEINRLKAKAIREQQRAGQSSTNASITSTTTTTTTGQKRPYDAVAAASAQLPGSNSRDGAAASLAAKAHESIQPARKFARDAYIEYDFSRMTDTKGGFLTAEDDPHNKALHVPDQEQKPAHMTLKEWERHCLLKKLRDQKAGPFEPGLSVLKREGRDGEVLKEGCRECGGLEIDWTWLEVFGVRVCGACKEKLPEKYSLLTKTEAREDYLLTDPELKDAELLPHLEKPNPHKSTWNNMMLYLRFQVEEYAFKRWGGAEKLDEEFAKREREKKVRKEKKFAEKLRDLKKRTRVEAVRRNRGRGAEEGREGREAQFGDVIRNRGDRHEHEWGRTVVNEEGMSVKKCVECGMEVEELEF